MDPAVSLVRAYLEFCGYFVLAELPVKERYGAGYRDTTDLDVVAVRFPHPPQAGPGRRARPLEVYLGADPLLDVQDNTFDVIIGEVKEGRARLNRALGRAEVVAFALRRTGCCPAGGIPGVARTVVRNGTARMEMPGRVSCRVRLAVFAGRTEGMSGQKALVIDLASVLGFLRERLYNYEDVLAGTRFKDTALALLNLQAKLSV